MVFISVKLREFATSPIASLCASSSSQLDPPISLSTQESSRPTNSAKGVKKKTAADSRQIASLRQRVQV